MTKQPPTRDEIIKVWKELDATSEKPVGKVAVARAMGISPFWIDKRFVGKSLTDMKRQHDIRLSPQEQHKSDDELLLKLDGVVSDQRRIPPWNILHQKTGIAESTWKKKLGGRRGCSQGDVYKKYEEWLRAKKAKSPNLEIVTRFLQGPHKPKETPDIGASPVSRAKRIPTYQKADRREYGRPLHFGNLTYEPTNEQGVVFLFGMVSKELGFESIEYLGTDFPDCEGKWKVGNQGRLQHVKIEFEFKSRSYDHPTDGCDVIVCWEDNWRDCPLLVIELKKEIKKLKDRAQT